MKEAKKEKTMGILKYLVVTLFCIIIPLTIFAGYVSQTFSSDTEFLGLPFPMTTFVSMIIQTIFILIIVILVGKYLKH